MGQILESVIKQYEKETRYSICPYLSDEGKKNKLLQDLSPWDHNSFIATGNFSNENIYKEILKDYCLKLGIKEPLNYDLIVINDHKKCHRYSGTYTNDEFVHNFKFYITHDGGMGGRHKLITNFCNNVIWGILENFIYDIDRIESYYNVLDTEGKVLFSYKEDFDWNTRTQRDWERNMEGCDFYFWDNLRSEFECEDLQNFSSDSAEDVLNEIESLRQEQYKNTCWDLDFCRCYCYLYPGGSCNHEQNLSLEAYDYTNENWDKILEERHFQEFDTICISDTAEDIQHEIETAKQELEAAELEDEKERMASYCITSGCDYRCRRDCDQKMEYEKNRFYKDGKWIEYDELESSEYDEPERDLTPYL